MILALSVGQVDPRPLWMLAGAFGGSVYAAPGRGNRRPAWTWQVSANKAADALQTLLPFLIVKREQAEIALQLQTGRVPGRLLSDEEAAHRQELFERLKAAKHQVFSREGTPSKEAAR